MYSHFIVTIPVQEVSSCITAANSDHVAQERATLKYGVLVYANGTSDYLGTNTGSTSLEEIEPNVWQKVTSCE